MEEIVIARDGSAYDARHMNAVKAIRAEKLSHELAHARMELRNGSGGGVPHVGNAVIETFLEPKFGQYISVE